MQGEWIIEAEGSEAWKVATNLLSCFSVLMSRSRVDFNSTFKHSTISTVKSSVFCFLFSVEMPGINLTLLNITVSWRLRRLIRHLIYFYGQFTLTLGKKIPYIFSKFDPHNTECPLILTGVLNVRRSGRSSMREAWKRESHRRKTRNKSVRVHFFKGCKL